TGGVTGVYYPLGGYIARLANRSINEGGIRYSVEATGGSVDNVNALKQGELDFGVAQSDVQYESFLGKGRFASAGPFTDLRSVFSIHPEPFTVVARKDSGIRSFDDLKGKRVNIGNAGSGQRAMTEFLMEKKGWTQDDFKVVMELPSSEQAKALADNEVDAIIFTVGHPNGSIQEAATLAETVIVPVEGEFIDGIVEEYPYYAYATIPGGTYKGNEDPIPTFGVRATLVTTADEDDAVVTEVVRAVFGNFDTFRRLHPAFSVLNPQEMVKESLAAPLHPAARAYYVEQGLLEP
ncbi:MAG: TAXI family TRAP transporter solute-binding subunit, partial [Puniceicoccales bacterium]